MYQEIEHEEVQRRLENGEKLNLIDVREDFEYEERHIPGAVLIPLGTLPEHLDSLDKDKEYIMVCRRANRSRVATELLQANGFTNVKNMLGGMSVWQGETNPF